MIVARTLRPTDRKPLHGSYPYLNPWCENFVETHIFRRLQIAQTSAETGRFHKFFTPGI